MGVHGGGENPEMPNGARGKGKCGGGENPEMPNEARWGKGSMAGKDGTKRWKMGRRWNGVSPFCR